MRTLMNVVLVALAFASANGAQASAGLKLMARNRLRSSAKERVAVIASSKFTVDSVLSIPKNVTKEKQAQVVKVLEDQEKMLEKNLAQISSLEKQEKSKDEKEKSKTLKAHMNSKDAAMMNKFDEWSERMNKKTRLGAMDVLSKLKNAVHLIKKGALTGDAKSADNLNKVLESMGQMAGVSTPKQTFLH